MKPKFQQGQRVKVTEGDWAECDGYILSVNTMEFPGFDASISYQIQIGRFSPIIGEKELELIPESPY